MQQQKEITYKGYVLDPFQREALEHIEQGRSVIVSAPTGVGKTLIADYLTEKAVRENKKVIYTAPIKALSNQKYRQFKESLGADNVGIITGDVVHNSEAPVLIMTTEIYRNIVLAEPERAANIHYLIFDEIHYIDSDRGVAWEESIIFAPPHVKFLGLSATIGNVEEFVGWLSQVRNEPVALVIETIRAVPLAHRFYNRSTGICTLPDMQKAAQRGRLKQTNHRDLVSSLRKEYLPALLFLFSRRQCMERAIELLPERSFLTRQEAERVTGRLDEYEANFRLSKHDGFRLMRELLEKGIAYHHAGLLPLLKDLVEELFEERLVKVLYCTETFAVGVNYPVQSVCFLEQRKYDGTSMRALTAQEYMQMAGRAGRRGIDNHGYVFTLVDGKPAVELVDYASQQIDRLGSQFRLSANSILNLMQRNTEEQIDAALTSSFASYLNEQDRRKLNCQVAKCQQTVAELVSATCLDTEELSCPVNYRRARSKLGGLERDAKRYGRGYLKRQAAQLRSRLAEVTARSCSPEEVSICRERRRELVVARERLASLEKELQALPTSGDWRRRYHDLRQALEQLDYIDGDQVLPRGELASEINFQEVLITEFVFAGMLDDLSVPELCGLLTGVDFVGRYSDYTQRERLPALRKFYEIADDLKMNDVLGPSIIFSPQAVPLGYRWAKGTDFAELKETTTIEEGDIVSLLRRTVDTLRQLRKGVGREPFWGAKLKECQEAMERDIVKVEL